MSNNIEVTINQVQAIIEAEPDVSLSLQAPGLQGAIGPAGIQGPIGVTGAQGPVGPAGLDAPVSTIRIDSSIVSTLYVGRASQGSLESSAVWTVRKSTFDSAGVRTSIGTAVNVTWTGRTGHTYS